MGMESRRASKRESRGRSLGRPAMSMEEEEAEVDDDGKASAGATLGRKRRSVKSGKVKLPMLVEKMRAEQPGGGWLLGGAFVTMWSFFFSGLNVLPVFTFVVGVLCAHLSGPALGNTLGELYVLTLSFKLFRPFMWTRKQLQKKLKHRVSSSGDQSYNLLSRVELSIFSWLQFHSIDSTEQVFVDLEDSRRIPIFTAILAGDCERVRDLMADHYDQANSAGAKPFLFAVLLQKIDIAEMMLNDSELGRRVVAQSYTDAGSAAIFTGETALHIGIVGKNIDFVHNLLKKAKRYNKLEELLNTKATGQFFQPLQDGRLKKEVEMISQCEDIPIAAGRSMNHLYYGEWALSFCAATNQPDMYDLLLRFGADPFAQDECNGNNALHIAVEHNSALMVRHILNLERLRRVYQGDEETALEARDTLLGARNRENMTPIHLAAERGHAEALNAIIHVKRTLYWKYASITAYTFPLEDLLEPGGVLDRVVQNKHLDLVKLPLISTIFIKQWNCGFDKLFRQKFYLWVLYLAALIVVSIDVSQGALPHSTLLHLAGSQLSIVSWLIATPVMVYLAVGKLQIELLELLNSDEESIANKVADYLGGSATEILENVFSSSSCLFALAGVLLRSRLMFGAALFSGFLYMLFFLLGYRETGIFVTTIVKLLVDDVIVFSVLLMVIVPAFSFFFFHAAGANSLEHFPKYLDSAFATILGDYDATQFRDDSTYTWFIESVSMVYALFISVTLINSLVAQMTIHFEEFSTKGGLYWIIERARIMKSIASEHDGYGRMIYTARRQKATRKRAPGNLVQLSKFWIDERNSDEEVLDENEPLKGLLFEYHEEDPSYYNNAAASADA